MRVRLLRVGLWLTAVLVVVVITVLSFIPNPPLVWDKLGHAAAYAVLIQSILLAAAWAPGLGEGRWWKYQTSIVVAVVCFGALIEVLQGAYFSRTADVLDATANAAGTGIGVAAWYGLRRAYATP
jgi:VanZ family protein